MSGFMTTNISSSQVRLKSASRPLCRIFTKTAPLDVQKNIPYFLTWS